MGLAVIAEARQAAVSEIALRLYSKRLATENFTAVEAAIAELAERERRDGETAFPSLGTVLAAVRRHRPKTVFVDGRFVLEGSPEARGYIAHRGEE